MDSEKKHITFIVNPISGTQEKEQIIALINEYLDIDKYTFQIIYTQYAGHAEEIAAQCAEDSHFAVVAVGGDGTVNEVARALTHTHTALGIIPCGSGNGLARHLQISMQPRKAIEAMRIQSEQNGNAELTLDDINEEIRLTRKARKIAV